MNVEKLIESYLGREVDFESEVILHDNGDGKVYIYEWNIPEQKPTKQQLTDLWATKKDEIEQAQAIRELDIKYHKTWMREAFDAWKANDSEYQAELSAITG